MYTAVHNLDTRLSIRTLFKAKINQMCLKLDLHGIEIYKKWGNISYHCTSVLSMINYRRLTSTAS
jgi:hypothetical protein